MTPEDETQTNENPAAVASDNGTPPTDGAAGNAGTPAADAPSGNTTTATVTDAAAGSDSIPPKSVTELLNEFALAKWAELREHHTYLSPDEQKKTVVSELEAYVAKHEMPLGDNDLLAIAEQARTVDQPAQAEADAEAEDEEDEE